MSDFKELEVSLLRHLELKFGGEAKKSEILTSIGAYIKITKDEREALLSSLVDKGDITVEKRWSKELSVGAPGVYVILNE